MKIKKRLVKSKALLHIAILLVVFILFVLSPIYIMAVAGESYYEVGAINYSTFSAGTLYESFWVGTGTSPSPTPTPSSSIAMTLARLILPVVGIIVIVAYAIRMFYQQYGFNNFMVTVMVFLIGAALLVAVIQYLSSI